MNKTRAEEILGVEYQDAEIAGGHVISHAEMSWKGPKIRGMLLDEEIEAMEVLLEIPKLRVMCARAEFFDENVNINIIRVELPYESTTKIRALERFLAATSKELKIFGTGGITFPSKPNTLYFMEFWDEN